MAEKNIKKNKKIKIVICIFVILILLLIGFYAVKSWYLNYQLDKIDYDNELNKNEIEVNTGVAENLSKYRNIALFGLDSRTDSLDNSRSDCIIIVSINEDTKEVKLLSVYRDTYLQLTGRSLDKVTHAYIYGGAKLALSTLNTNLDLNITEYVTVNFETVKTVVDAIDGVQITVTDAEANSIPNISEAGTYNLNGEQALAYSRIRKIDTDYKRTERMRDVLMAVFEKVKTMDLMKLNQLLNIVLPHMRTNISNEEILALMPDIMSYKVKESLGWPYVVRAYTTPTWYGAPVTLESNVKRLHQELFNEEDYTVSDTVKEISNKIINETGYKE